MRRMSLRMLVALAACVAGGLGQREASAQSLGNGSSALGAMGMSAAMLPSLTGQTGTGGLGTTSSSITTPVPLFGTTISSPLADPTASATGSTSTSTGMMSSPFAAPFLYSSMMQATMPPGAFGSSSSTSGSTGTSMGMGMMNPASLGLLMLATQNNGGVGSGRLSGSAQASQASSAAKDAAMAKRRAVNRPGGLAARYFNRVGTHTPYPQSYFNRQSRYFP